MTPARVGVMLGAIQIGHLVQAAHICIVYLRAYL